MCPEGRHPSLAVGRTAPPGKSPLTPLFQRGGRSASSATLQAPLFQRGVGGNFHRAGTPDMTRRPSPHRVGGPRVTPCKAVTPVRTNPCRPRTPDRPSRQGCPRTTCPGSHRCPDPRRPGRIRIHRWCTHTSTSMSPFLNVGSPLQTVRHSKITRTRAFGSSRKAEPRPWKKPCSWMKCRLSSDQRRVSPVSVRRTVVIVLSYCPA